MININNKFEINFNNFDHNFCESMIYSYGSHPEYLNSASSLFITFIGLNGLASLINLPNNFFLQLLFSALVINGITSCFYHRTNNIGWGLLDRMSMILIAMSCTYLFMEHLDKFIKYKNKKFILVGVHLLVCTYYTILFTVSGLHMESVFNVLFGVFLASLSLFMLLVNQHQNLDTLNIDPLIIKFGWKGIKYIGLSGIFWITTENLCYNIWFIKYLFGHVWWHIFVSYGGYLLSLVPNYLTLMYKYTNKEIEIKSNIFNLPYLGIYNK